MFYANANAYGLLGLAWLWIAGEQSLRPVHGKDRAWYIFCARLSPHKCALQGQRTKTP